MSARLKITIILLGTLLFGTVIGALFAGFLRNQQINRLGKVPPQERFVRGMDRIIRPDEKQRADLEKLLEKHYANIARVREKHQAELISIYDSLRIEMEKLLTPEQLERVEQHLQRGVHKLSRIRLDRLTKELELTPEQRRQLQKIFERMEMGMRRRGPGRRMGMRRQMNRLQAEIKEILTPAQQEKLNRLQWFHNILPGPPPDRPGDFFPGPPDSMPPGRDRNR